MTMEYRRLGRSGLKVSVLSFGSWVSFGAQLDTGLARDCLAAACDGGVNFFDNAEAYAGGESERIMGAAIAELGWQRETLRGVDEGLLGPAPRASTRGTRSTASTCMHAIDGSLERFGLDFVDVVVLPPARPGHADRGDGRGRCPTSSSRARRTTGARRSGRADEIRAAWDIADRHNLHKPVTEQPQYNLFERRRVEREYARALRGHRARPHHVEPARVGPADRQVPRRRPATTAAPRFPGYEWLKDTSPTARNGQVRELKAVAARARLHAVAAGDRVVCAEPARVHGHHGRQPARAGRSRTWARSTCVPKLTTT